MPSRSSLRLTSLEVYYTEYKTRFIEIEGGGGAKIAYYPFEGVGQESELVLARNTVRKCSSPQFDNCDSGMRRAPRSIGLIFFNNIIKPTPATRKIPDLPLSHVLNSELSLVS